MSIPNLWKLAGSIIYTHLLKISYNSSKDLESGPRPETSMEIHSRVTPTLTAVDQRKNYWGLWLYSCKDNFPLTSMHIEIIGPRCTLTKRKLNCQNSVNKTTQAICALSFGCWVYKAFVTILVMCRLCCRPNELQCITPPWRRSAIFVYYVINAKCSYIRLYQGEVTKRGEEICLSFVATMLFRTLTLRSCRFR